MRRRDDSRNISVPEGCAAVLGHATIGSHHSTAMLDFSGLASFHNGFAVLEKGSGDRRNRYRLSDASIPSCALSPLSLYVCFFFLFFPLVTIMDDATL